MNMKAEFQCLSRELLVEIDLTGTIKDISANCDNILGYNKSEMIGTNISDYKYDNNEEINIKLSNIFEVALKKKDGVKGLYDAAVCVDVNDRAKISLFDISKCMPKKENDKKFKTMLENAKDIVYSYEIIPERKFTYMNKAFEELLQIPVEKAYEDSMLLFDIVHPDERYLQYKKVDGTANFVKPMQMRMKNSNGEYIWFEDYVHPFYNKKGELEAISGFCRNIQDRKELEEKLEEFSYRDSLTGLFSRNYYHEQEKQLNEVEDIPIGIIICDMDNLKVINDSLGHTYGDRLLIRFGHFLKEQSEKDSVVARFGGDEFVILIKNKSEDSVKKTYDKLQQSMENVNDHNQVMPMKASIGWAYSPTSIGIVKKVFNIADEMMYEKKYIKQRN